MRLELHGNSVLRSEETLLEARAVVLDTLRGLRRLRAIATER